MKPSEDTNRMQLVIEDAEWTFWAVVAKAYPEAQSGDFSPTAAMELDTALTQAVTHWLQANADPVVDESAPRVTEILLHRIEYSYQKDMELTDGDEEHIAYCISQGMREGELSTIISDDESVRGYWAINNV